MKLRNQLKIKPAELRLFNMMRQLFQWGFTRFGMWILFIVCFSVQLEAQTNQNGDSLFITSERTIREKMAQIYQSKKTDLIIDSLNQDLLSYLTNILSVENSISYPFDSIQPISKVVSDDKSVRIFTWNVVYSDGSSRYFGFVQYQNKTEKKVSLFRLTDSVPASASIENATLLPDNWFGAIYYQLIETKIGSDKLYTLLGWCSRDIYLNKKVIESLMFTDDGRPVFGKPVFNIGKTKYKRIVFTYARRATMLVTFDQPTKMIVMDHLAPVSPIYENNFNYYGPDFSYDGLTFKDDMWNFSSMVDYKQPPVQNKKWFKQKNR